MVSFRRAHVQIAVCAPSRSSVFFGRRPNTVGVFSLQSSPRTGMCADCITLPELEVPHPRAHERAFVLLPLAEVAPALVHPTLGRSIAELATARSDADEVTPRPRPAGWPGTTVPAGRGALA